MTTLSVLVLALAALCVGDRVSEVTAFPLSRTRLEQLAKRPFFHNDTKAIAVVRVPDTPGIRQVETFIKTQLGALGDLFTVEVDEFVSATPFGQKTFRNIVATLKRDAGLVPRSRRLVLAAHYDSKYFPGSDFVGATDSAVPCAMLLDMARMVAASETRPLAWGLQFVFFDGEEAFQQWTATDSTYGSRHLAAKWAAEGCTSPNAIDNIALFVLLDLIGVSTNRFASFFPATSLQFKELSYLSRQLKKQQLLHDNDLSKSYFGDNVGYGGIEDDHLPFLRLGVPVLHLISVPFPNEWHTARDNLDALDHNTIEDLAAVFRVFLASLLNLTESRAQ